MVRRNLGVLTGQLIGNRNKLCAGLLLHQHKHLLSNSIHTLTLTPPSSTQTFNWKLPFSSPSSSYSLLYPPNLHFLQHRRHSHSFSGTDLETDVTDVEEAGGGSTLHDLGVYKTPTFNFYLNREKVDELATTSTAHLIGAFENVYKPTKKDENGGVDLTQLVGVRLEGSIPFGVIVGKNSVCDVNLRGFSLKHQSFNSVYELDAPGKVNSRSFSTTRFCKQHKGRMKGLSSQGNRICFGRYALQALEPAWITSRQIEAGRRAIVLNTRRGGKIWVRLIPDKPVTVRPAETRMGKGKGSPAYWVAVVKPGRILYEMRGVPENIAKSAISIAASKMPIRTQFILL